MKELEVKIGPERVHDLESYIFVYLIPKLSLIFFSVFFFIFLFYFFKTQSFTQSSELADWKVPLIAVFVDLISSPLEYKRLTKTKIVKNESGLFYYLSGNKYGPLKHIKTSEIFLRKSKVVVTLENEVTKIKHRVVIAKEALEQLI